jgi:hypothetical protein
LGLIFLLSLAGFVYLGTRFVFRTRASGLNLALKLKLQGSYRVDTKTTFRIDLYSQGVRVATFNGAQLNYTQNKLFEGILMLNQELDLTKSYALFIKPEKYLGQLFCSPTKAGTDCTVGEFTFTSGLNQADLSSKLFYAGDLSPQDGRVDSADISKILAKIGKADTTTDINQDGIVNSIDYTLTQKTLSLNKADDQITLTATTLTPTLTPAPSLSPSPIPASPTPTTVAGRGRCNGVVTGEVHISYLGQTECRVLDETDYRCVEKPSDCTQAACLTFTKEAIREGVTRCGYGMATFDENSPISCTVNFTSDPNCTDPVEETSCDDESQKCN